MRCTELDVERYAEDLILEAAGINTGLRTVEAHCHIESGCDEKERAFQEYIAHVELPWEDLGLIYEGKEVLEELANPQSV